MISLLAILFVFFTILGKVEEDEDIFLRSLITFILGLIWLGSFVNCLNTYGELKGMRDGIVYELKTLSKYDVPIENRGNGLVVIDLPNKEVGTRIIEEVIRLSDDIKRYNGTVKRYKRTWKYSYFLVIAPWHLLKDFEPINIDSISIVK